MLDRINGDAIGVMVDDKSDFAGLVANYPGADANSPTGVEIGTQGKEAFVRVLDATEKKRAALLVGPDGIPSLWTYDAEGKEQFDALRGSPAKH